MLTTTLKPHINTLHPEATIAAHRAIGMAVTIQAILDMPAHLRLAVPEARGLPELSVPPLLLLHADVR